MMSNDLSKIESNEQLPSQQLTRLLVAWSNGEASALEELTPLIYDELRSLARRYMRRERSDHTLQNTALVHEAYLRLIEQDVQWNSRLHFFAIAAQMMRRILVDHARAHSAEKRGAGMPRVSLDVEVASSQKEEIDLLALDEALDRLSAVDPQRSRIVELRFFGGLSKEECAQVMGISPATVQRQWAGTKAWLHHELRQRDRK
jgi:RNA polymerase sigma-70 factor (ECF subfamily)